ncbi:MAG: transglutaminase-like domain-containing protein [Methanothrix sp.]|jgi:transglutaminase-like putative cysteine protease|nr:transglutaminase-like domain-containing protein [Methanothrix sp.]
MSTPAVWFFLLLIIGLGAAADVPFVFEERTSDIADYTSTELQQASSASRDIAGVPLISAPSDDEILEFPLTGGGSTQEGMTSKRVGDLKQVLSARVEPENAAVRHEAVVIAANYPGDHSIDQICSIYDYLKNGRNTKKGWSYVPDPRGIDYFMYANETLAIGKDAGCVGAGDCDDFAILMAALVESIGGTTRIILAHNNSTGGHAYTEVYLGQINSNNSQTEDIVDWLKQKYDIYKVFTHIDTNAKDVWLNLDWGPDEKGNAHPGGPFYQGDKHIVLCIRDLYGKTSLKVPESHQEKPKSNGNEIAPASTADKKAEGLEMALACRVEPDNSRVREVALKFSGDLTIEQVCSIYLYLRSGDSSKRGWLYSNGGIDNIKYANETLQTNDADFTAGGDEYDFAVVIASLVESIGGTARIILADFIGVDRIYAEVYLGSLDDKNNQVEKIINRLKQTYTGNIYTTTDPSTNDVWLSLAWGGRSSLGNVYPGGYPDSVFSPHAKKSVVVYCRDQFNKVPLKVSEQ